jgi:hypothetical protein
MMRADPDEEAHWLCSRFVPHRHTAPSRTPGGHTLKSTGFDRPANNVGPSLSCSAPSEGTKWAQDPREIEVSLRRLLK